ncbi:hypothetical protein [Bremerella cremea]|uniref:TubC N-terminal docking domain-related protein n=1 Tax=Bremerella cremea TaxID=1031537 RepID=UPI0031EB0F0D
MNARHVIDTLTSQGIRLVVEGNRLRYHPKESINDDQVELLKTHKQQIICLLSRPEPTDEASWPDTIDGHALEPCPKCGTLELWENLAGNWRCLRCDPPTRWRKFAAKHGLPTS